MSFIPPTLERQNHKTMAKCGHCDIGIRIGDLVLRYVSSSFHNSTHWRMVHFKCLLEKSQLDIGGILMLAGMPEVRT